MQISEYKNIFENEETHFFYTSLHRLILGLVSNLGMPPRAQILDAGCGTGYLAKKLQGFGDVIGLDFSKEALKYAEKRGIKTVEGRVVQMPFKAGSFNLVTSIDVVYHSSIKDDLQVLKEFCRVLEKNGYLILRVPANKALHLRHDKHVHTRERYDKSELKRKLKKAGFQITMLSYIGLTLLPLAFAKQLTEFFTMAELESGISKPNSFVNTILKIFLSIENFLILRGVELPFGIGLIAIARKI